VSTTTPNSFWSLAAILTRSFFEKLIMGCVGRRRSGLDRDRYNSDVYVDITKKTQKIERTI
jgi:hypothetical protein